MKWKIIRHFFHDKDYKLNSNNYNHILINMNKYISLIIKY